MDTGYWVSEKLREGLSEGGRTTEHACPDDEDRRGGWGGNGIWLVDSGWHVLVVRSQVDWGQVQMVFIDSNTCLCYLRHHFNVRNGESTHTHKTNPWFFGVPRLLPNSWEVATEYPN